METLTDGFHLPEGETPIVRVAHAVRYAGRAAQAVCRLKYERVTSLAGPLADKLSTAAPLDEFDLILPIPIHWRRRWMRGFNQSELLCRCLPTEKVRFDLLRRSRYTVPQVKLSPLERRENLLGAFTADPSVSGKRILLVDDVYTTGSTAKHAALALLEQGAKEVSALTLAGRGAPGTFGL